MAKRYPASVGKTTLFKRVPNTVVTSYSENCFNICIVPRERIFNISLLNLNYLRVYANNL